MYLNLINPMTLHKNCPGQGLTKLKYKVFSPIFWSGQFHLDLRTDFTSTWLCSKIFWSWIQNSSSPTSKHSELLVSHLMISSRRDTYIYIPSEWFLIVECSKINRVQWNILLYVICMPYQHLHTFWLRGQPTYMAHNDLCLICLSS